MFVFQSWIIPSKPSSLIVEGGDEEVSEETAQLGFKSDEDEQRNIAINRRRPSGANASGKWNFHMFIFRVFISCNKCST